MISRIDHVSIAVRDYERARRFFCDILGAIPGVWAEDREMQYYWQIFSLGDLSRLELMKATGPNSFLEGFLDSRGGGVHHITLETPDINVTQAKLEELGIPTFGRADLADEWKELFIHPRDAFGVLIQIAQFDPADWVDPSVNMPPGETVSVTAEPDAEGCTLTAAHPGGGRVSIRLSDTDVRQLIKDLEQTLTTS